MFRRISAKQATPIEFNFEGQTIIAEDGETVAAALLASGINQFRETPERGRARGPFCMMGVCFDCLMVIDGEENSQACQVLVREGMHVSRQFGSVGLNADQGELA